MSDLWRIYASRLGRFLGKAALVIGVNCGMWGCAGVIRPSLGPEKTKAAAYDQSATLPNAIAVGASMRDSYTDQIADQIAIEKGTGLGLIGATTLAADLAIRQVSKSQVLGLGLFTAAAYTSSNWLVNKPRLGILAAGANAVQCAMTAVQPLQKPYGRRQELSDALATVKGTTVAVRALAPADTTVTAIAAQGDQAYAVGIVALQKLDAVGPDLRASLSQIERVLTIAYIDQNTDLKSLIASLGSALPTLGSQIIGTSLLAEDKPAGARHANIQSVRELKKSIATVLSISDDINLRWYDKTLEKCVLNPQQFTATISISPAGGLSITAGTIGSAVASGGVAPYRVDWIETQPPATDATLRIESGQGIIIFDTRSSLTPGKYRLLVRDATSGRQEVVVNVLAPLKKADAGGGAMKPELKKINAKAPDPMLKKVQEAVIATGIKTVTVKDPKTGVETKRPFLADGLAGPFTEAALTKFYTDNAPKPIPEDSVPSGVKLVDVVANLLGIKK